MIDYLTNVGTALSQLLHSLAGGDPKVTTSARLGKQVLRRERWAVLACRVISVVLRDEDHCLKAYRADRHRADQAHR